MIAWIMNIGDCIHYVPIAQCDKYEIHTVGYVCNMKFSYLYRYIGTKLPLLPGLHCLVIVTHISLWQFQLDCKCYNLGYMNDM